jgi:hypothetical protein
MPTTPKMNTHKRPTLSMQIYAAMLGDAPKVERATPITRPRLKMRVRLEARLEHAGSSQFHRTSLREHVERCAAYAARAIDEARERIAQARPKPMAPLGDRGAAADVKPIVLIGPAARGQRTATPEVASRAA